MANIKIVTDSSITIEPEVVKEYGITIVPLSVMVDGVLYSDSELGEGDFLRLMQSSKNLPKTSQPPVGVFAEMYEDLAAGWSSYRFDSHVPCLVRNSRGSSPRGNLVRSRCDRD